VTGNLTIYYNQKQLKLRDFRGPDFFVVLGAKNRDRKSWFIWEENGQYPHVIVELLSDSTAKVDRGLKKQLYQDIFRTPDYFWFHPHTLEFAGFHLEEGEYQPIVPNDQGHLWCQSLGLFLGIAANNLHLFTATGEKILLPEEAEYHRAETERQRAETERQRAEIAEAKVAALLARLQQAGLDQD
jgi:Uma2 family endonuclease